MEAGAGRWNGLAGTGIPVGGVAEVAFDTVKVGMDPGAHGLGNIIAKRMGIIPAIGVNKPERFLGGGALRRWFCEVRFEGGEKLFACHGKSVGIVGGRGLV